MKIKRNASGFTLIEVLIVVVIMAVLAATIIPQFSTSTKDSRESSLKFNLQTLRTQIELYRTQHNGTLPSQAKFLEQLTESTNSAGMTSGTNVPDPMTSPLGPYISGKTLPSQPFSGSTAVRFDSNTGPLTGAPVAPGAGWVYRPATGEIFVDHDDYKNF